MTRQPIFKSSVLDHGAFTNEHRKLVYDTSRWQSYLYEMRGRATEASEVSLRAPLREDANLANAPATDVADFAHAIGRELFSRLYGEPSKLESPDAPQWMGRVHSTLDEMPEWETLRKNVHSDPDFSAIATNAMLKALQPKLADLIKQVEEEERQESGQGQQGGEGGQDAGSRQGAGNGAGTGAGLPTAQDALRASLRAACGAAAGQTQEVKQMVGGLAPGLDATPPTDLQSDTDRFDLINAVMRDPRIADAVKRAGRLRRISGRAEMRRSVDSYEEVVDVEMGGDLDRLIPSEIMNLMDDDLEILELARIVEKTALQYRLEGHEPVGRGPMIYLRDISGSMTGDGHLWGAAVAIALSAQATRENRPLVSANFNSYVHNMRRLDSTGLYEVGHDGKTGRRLVSGKLAGGKAALMHATDYVSGGTSFDAPLRWALIAGVEEPKADFIFLTDGHAGVSDDVLSRLQAAKEKGLRVFGFTVNGGSVSGPVRAICNEVVDVDSCKDEGEITRRVGRALRGAR